MQLASLLAEWDQLPHALIQSYTTYNVMCTIIHMLQPYPTHTHTRTHTHIYIHTHTHTHTNLEEVIASTQVRSKLKTVCTHVHYTQTA